MTPHIHPQQQKNCYKKVASGTYEPQDLYKRWHQLLVCLWTPPYVPTVYPRHAFCRVRMVVMICQPRPTLNYFFPGLAYIGWCLPMLSITIALQPAFCKEGFQSVSWPWYFLFKNVGSKNRRNMRSKNPELWIHMNPYVLLGQYWFWYLLVVCPKETCCSYLQNW